MDCLLCGAEVIYQGLLKQECINATCSNFSPSLRDTELPPPHPDDDDYHDWSYNPELGIWYKHETY